MNSIDLFYRNTISSPGTHQNLRSSLALSSARQSRSSKNEILNSLSSDEWERLSTQGRSVLLHKGQVLHHENKTPTHVYFVEVGVVSLQAVIADGQTLEVASVGREGLIGAAYLESNQPLHRATVQIAGKAYAIPYRVLRDEYNQNARLNSTINGYFQTLLSQVTQTAVCNSLHCIEERVSRWLLCYFDQFGSDELEVTHDQIASLLGIRRSGVTETMKSLRANHIIDTRRGGIVLLDRPELEQRTCACYKSSLEVASAPTQKAA